MSPLAIVLISLALILIIGGSPRWPYSQTWGYAAPSFGVVLLIIFAILVYMGRIHLNIN